jgi:choline-glycine betaine transporter
LIFLIFFAKKIDPAHFVMPLLSSTNESGIWIANRLHCNRVVRVLWGVVLTPDDSHIYTKDLGQL